MPRGQRIADSALLGLAGVLAVAAVVSANSNDMPETTSARILASGFYLVAAIAFGWAGWQRAAHEGGRRRWFLLLTAGGTLWLGGQFLRYALLPDSMGPDPRLRAVPWILGLPPALVGLIGMAWPADLDREDRWHAVLDGVLGIGALAVIWSEVVLQAWSPADHPAGQMARWGLWAEFVGFAALIVFVVSSRRMGALPLPQLLMLFGGLAIVLLSATVRDLTAAALPQGPLWLVGYWIGTALITIMLQRSPAETETAGERAARAVIAFLVPFLLVVAAGLVVIGLAAESRPDSMLLAAAPVLWIIGMLAVGAASVFATVRIRTDRRAEVSDELAVSAESGWIRALLQDSSEFVFVLGLQGDIVYQSPNSRTVLGETRSFQDVVLAPSEHDLQTLLSGIISRAIPAGPHDVLMRAADGSELTVEVYLRPIREVAFEGFVASATDVTESRQWATRLESTGRRDQLTGLLSSEALASEVGQALRWLDTTKGGLAYAVVDLVDFGVWNDSLGRGAGDSILQAVAMHVESLPGVEAVGRVGGDSFGVLLHGMNPLTSVQTCLDGLSSGLHGLILADDTEIDLSLRAGFTIVDAGQATSITAAMVLEQADVALRRARHSRHAHSVRFRTGMNEDLVRRLTAERQVREALANDGIHVHYQPVVSMADGHLVAVESLARIRSANGELITPDHFIEAAERTGLIADVGRVVRGLALRDWNVLNATVGSIERVGVNVAEKELTTDLVDELLASNALPHMVIEVTESSILSNPEQAGETLRRIREAGALVAIDDFGTGYSSMAQVATLPCDILKIDRSFIAAMMHQPKSMSLVRAMIQLGHDLGLQMVAEGVETADQAASLRALDCDHGQGFYYARPTPLSDLLASAPAGVDA